MGTEKTLSVYTLVVEAFFEERLKRVCPDCVITAGMYPHERAIKFCFPAEVSLAEAYQRITTLWAQAFPKGEEKILFFAQDFKCACGACNKKPAASQ